MSVREIRVESLGDLVDHVTPVGPDPVTGRRRYSGVYHGSVDAQWPLLTSLDRLGGIDPPHTKADLEEHILRNFIRYSRPYVGDTPANEWEFLVMAQHHEVPTRLLDWTYSPLVAAHFATGRDDRAQDRAIWKLDWQMVHRHFGLPSLALLIQDLGRLRSDGRGFAPWDLFHGHSEMGDFACMLEPPSISTRIVAQSAVFTLCSDKTQSFDGFLERQGLADALTKYLIPANKVALFRDQLDLVGMDERRLFPDLYGVAVQLRRYYS